MIGQLEREKSNIIVAIPQGNLEFRNSPAITYISRLDLELFSPQPDSPDFFTGSLNDTHYHLNNRSSAFSLKYKLLK